MSRFASITADIMARKGEASPWNETASRNETARAKAALPWQPPPAKENLMERKRPQSPPPPAVEHDGDDTRLPDRKAHDRKVSVRMSQHDYERLGILAVKQGKSRQGLLQEAVDRLFTGMTAQFGPSCGCLGAPTSRADNSRSRELQR